METIPKLLQVINIQLYLEENHNRYTVTGNTTEQPGLELAQSIAATISLSQIVLIISLQILIFSTLKFKAKIFLQPSITLTMSTTSTTITLKL